MTAQILTPLALANADVLREIRDGGHDTGAALARAIGRDKSNVAKSLKLMAEAGLLKQPDANTRIGAEAFYGLTVEGLAALEAWERAEDPQLVAGAAATTAPIFHCQIRPDPQNPRRDFDSDEAKAALQELTASIVRDDLLENLVLRPIADTFVSAPWHSGEADSRPAFMIIAGERRWRAIGQAIAAGDLPEDWPVPHSIRNVDEVTARRLALVENLQRRDLKPLEEARALQQLVELDGRTTAEIADDIGFTQRWAQQRLQLLQLSPKLQGLLDDGWLKIEGARTVLSIWDRLPPIKRAELEAGKTKPDEAKAWLEQQPTPLSDAAKLAAMELWVKLAAAPYKASYSGKATRIVGTIERTDRGDNGVSVKVRVDDPNGAFAELRKRMIIEEPGRVYDEGVETGEVYVSTGYNGEHFLRQTFPSALDAKFRKSSIPTLRLQVYGLQVDYAAGQSGGYSTPWLETPTFTPKPEVAAEIEQKRAARVDRELKARKEQEVRDAQHAEAKRLKQARLEAAAAIEPELRQAMAVNVGAFTGSLIARSSDLGWTLPLYLDEDGSVIDAGGREVSETVYSYQREERLPFLRFLVAAVNVAAGLATPATRPVEMAPDAMPREDFLAQVVAGLVEESDEEGAPTPMSEDLAEAIAPKALERMLAEEGWVYGEADAYDWTMDGAASFAGAIQRGEFVTDDDAQLDIEEAIAAQGEEEATPDYLRTLAGPGADAEAR